MRVEKFKVLLRMLLQQGAEDSTSIHGRGALEEDYLRLWTPPPKPAASQHPPGVFPIGEIVGRFGAHLLLESSSGRVIDSHHGLMGVDLLPLDLGEHGSRVADNGARLVAHPSLPFQETGPGEQLDKVVIKLHSAVGPIALVEVHPVAGVHARSRHENPRADPRAVLILAKGRSEPAILEDAHESFFQVQVSAWARRGRTGGRLPGFVGGAAARSNLRGSISRPPARPSLPTSGSLPSRWGLLRLGLLQVLRWSVSRLHCLGPLRHRDCGKTLERLQIRRRDRCLWRGLHRVCHRFCRGRSVGSGFVHLQVRVERHDEHCDDDQSVNALEPARDRLVLVVDLIRSGPGVLGTLDIPGSRVDLPGSSRCHLMHLADLADPRADGSRGEKEALGAVDRFRTHIIDSSP